MSPQFLHQSAFVKWFRRMFTGGSNPDIKPELLKDGLYTDALNMRPASVDGSTGALEAVQGEAIFYPAPPATAQMPDPTSYVLNGSVHPNGQQVEFWSSPLFDPITGINPPFIRINGDIAAQSANIPYVHDRPHQYGVIENCGDRLGIIYPADHNADPLFWDVKAMLDALSTGSLLYFDAYTTDINSVIPNAPPSIPWPQFPECIVDLGSTVGLSVGQRSYSLRYVDDDGNRTNWGPETGLIPVPDIHTPNDSLPPPNYPRTVGGASNLLVPTQYGIVIEFRAENPFGYTSIEIKRRSYVDGQGIQGTGIQEIVARIGISFGQIGIITFIDPSDANINPPELVPDQEAVLELANIKAPKGVDVSDSRVKFANFRLEAKDIVLTFLSFAGKKMTAITKALTRVVGGQVIPDGYDNPYNCAVNRSAQRGGTAKYGIQFWDGANGLYPVVNIPEPFTPGTDEMRYPQRRDIKGANGAWGDDSSTFSEGGPIWAANVDVASQTAEGPVGDTFEVFSSGEQAKTDTERVTNPSLASGSTPGNAAGRRQTQFMMYGSTVPATVVPSGVMFIPSDTGYQPWDPRNNQSPTPGFNVPPTTSRLMDAAGTGRLIPQDTTDPSSEAFPANFLDQSYPFAPDQNAGRCFNPTHFALGGLLAGIDSGIPTGASVMSVVYNGDTRGEIVAQGLGSWVMERNQYNNPNWPPESFRDSKPATKNTSGLNAYFPDVAGGIIDQALWEDIQQNPGNYQIRFVCPLPFYPEIYAYSGQQCGIDNSDPGSPFGTWVGLCIASHIMDIMAHTSFLHDEGRVNVGEPGAGGMGYQPIVGSPAPAGNYVGFDKWRFNGVMDGITPVPPTSRTFSFWQQMAQFGGMTGQGGNSLFDLASLTLQFTGRTNYYRIQTQQGIYAPGAYTVEATPNSDDYRTDFDDPVVRAYHAPWHVINIIRVGATIPESNIEPYKNMGNHIALKQNLDVYQGGVQDFRLIGEREHYDCTNFLPTDFRYAYVRQPNGLIRTYLCSTGNTTIFLPGVLLDIATLGFYTAPDGTQVYGVYQSIVDTDGIRYLRFGNFTPPPTGSIIQIRYDKTAPMRVFGHDVTVAPVVHAIHDGQVVRDNVDDQVPQALNALQLGGLPFLHAGFGSNPRWFMPEQDDQTEEQIWINYLSSIRQLCIMWSAESRILPSMYVNKNSTTDTNNFSSQYFPAIHYVARPMNFSGGSQSLPPGGFFVQYQSDYPLEWNIFSYGGLRFLPGINYDYVRQPDIAFFGYPRQGITLNYEFCTGVIASLEFDPTQTDTPGQRTFLFQNMKVLSEESGEIKVIATATYPGLSGQNQYVWFQSATGRVLTGKNILTGASGEQVSTFVVSNYWGDEMRISRNIGLPDQLWQLWSKGYAPSGGGYADTFFWPDRRGWYSMKRDDIDDISRNKQLKKLLPILRDIPTGYVPHMAGFYNTKYQEAWGSIGAYTSGGVSKPPRLFVYSPQTNEWLGEYSYRFDDYNNHSGGVFGMRAGETWEIDSGYDISGTTREAWVYLPIIGDMGKYKEMVRWRVIGDKPDGMQLFDKDGVMMSDQSAAIQELFAPGTGFLWAKLYDSFEGQWWRVMTSYDPARRLAQDVRFFVKVIYNTTGEKTITALENQLKNIR